MKAGQSTAMPPSGQEQSRTSRNPPAVSEAQVPPKSRGRRASGLEGVGFRLWEEPYGKGISLACPSRLLPRDQPDIQADHPGHQGEDED